MKVDAISTFDDIADTQERMMRVCRTDSKTETMAMNKQLDRRMSE